MAKTKFLEVIGSTQDSGRNGGYMNPDYRRHLVLGPQSVEARVA